MKTLIFSLIFCSIFFSFGFAQKDTLLIDKKGRIVLPEKGDFSIGIGANPFFKYLGNMFSLTGENQLYLSLLNNQLYGKYFISSQNAIRVKLNLNQYSHQFDYKVRNDNNYSLFVTDKVDRKYHNFGLTIGYEWRKGLTRLQVSYGAEFNVRFLNTSNIYTYGNQYSSSNPFPTTYLFSSYYNRPLESKQVGGIGVGARIFTGVEYFILPKISIGGELGIGYTNWFNSTSKEKIEYWDWDTNSVRVDDYDYNSSSSATYTDILNGQIFILIHF